MRRNNERPLFIDIDGTLTCEAGRPWGGVIPARIAKVITMLKRGEQVVIWSGNGTTYARAFAVANGLTGAVCIGKPEACIDDNPDIRPRQAMPVLPPSTLDD